MNMPEKLRPQVGELATLAKRFDPAAVKRIEDRYPDFGKELAKGLPMGPEEQEWAYYVHKAHVALELANAAQQGIAGNTHIVMKRYALVQKVRTGLAIFTALLGGATLTVLGLGDAARGQLTAIATAISTLCNAALDAFAKTYNAARVRQALDIDHACWVLQSHGRELQLLIDHGRPVAELRDAINQCNTFAFELNANKKKWILLD